MQRTKMSTSKDESREVSVERKIVATEDIFRDVSEHKLSEEEMEKQEIGIYDFYVV
jgi:hypothetical protein